jgi:hypothetical protein
MKPLGAPGIVLLGLAPGAVAAVWWLSSIEGTDSAADLSTAALKVQCLASLLPIALFAVQLGMQAGYRRSALALVTAAVLGWPLVALIWSATELSMRVPILAETLIVILAAILPAIGTALRGIGARAAVPVAASLGSVIAALAIWFASGAWPGSPN